MKHVIIKWSWNFIVLFPGSDHMASSIIICTKNDVKTWRKKEFSNKKYQAMHQLDIRKLYEPDIKDI